MKQRRMHAGAEPCDASARCLLHFARAEDDAISKTAFLVGFMAGLASAFASRRRCVLTPLAAAAPWVGSYARDSSRHSASSSETGSQYLKALVCRAAECVFHLLAPAQQLANSSKSMSAPKTRICLR